MRTWLPSRTAHSRRCGRQAEQAPGFTLLELLVVIAVIGVLCALLLPALGRVKARGQQVDCMSRQRQWVAAFRMYVDDNENRIPREGYERLGGVTLNNWTQVRGLSTGGTSTDSDDVWYNALPVYASVLRAASYAPLAKRADFFRSSSLFHCAAAKFPEHVTKPKYFFAIFSIAMNSQLIEFPYGPTINYNEIQEDESRTVLFLDNLLEGERKVHPAQEDEYLGQPAAYADRFSARHYGGGNLAFADGHVKWFPGDKVVETDPQSPLRGGSIMPPVDIVWEPRHGF